MLCGGLVIGYDRGMTTMQAHRAMATLEDVFTNDGDAVVIDSNRISVRGGQPGVVVCGHGDGPFMVWFPLSKLTASEDL